MIKFNVWGQSWQHTTNISDVYSPCVSVSKRLSGTLHLVSATVPRLIGSFSVWLSVVLPNAHNWSKKFDYLKTYLLTIIGSHRKIKIHNFIKLKCGARKNSKYLSTSVPLNIPLAYFAWTNIYFFNFTKGLKSFSSTLTLWTEGNFCHIPCVQKEFD